MQAVHVLPIMAFLRHTKLSRRKMATLKEVNTISDLVGLLDCPRNQCATLLPFSLSPHALQETPLGEDLDSVYFANFQIRAGQPEAHITSENEAIGLYVHVDNRTDEGPGWKIKVTNNRSLWDKFRIEMDPLPYQQPEYC